MVYVISPFKQCIQYRDLILTMVARDISVKYKGSVLGILWAFLNPLFMLAIYTFVFKYVFNARWPTENAATVNYAVILFAGLVLHTWLADVMSRSVSMIADHANFVKKIQFPLIILPWIAVIAAGVQFLMGLVVLVLFMMVLGSPLHPEMVLLPLILVPFLMMLIGVAWLLAALGVFVKDLSQLIGTMVTMMLFTSTVFFSLHNAPEIIRPILLLNPLTIPLDALRNVMLFGQAPDWILLGGYSVVAFLVMHLGYFVFQRLNTLFADVL